MFASIFLLGLLSFGPTAAIDNPTTKFSASEHPPISPAKHLRPFKSKRELKAFLEQLYRQNRNTGKGSGFGTGDGSPGTVSETVTVTSSAEQQESITNTQYAGVDEGGIVKMYGKYLVVLRRGRLFTVDIGENSLRSVSNLNAYGPNLDPDGAWYDEMLIAGNNIVVIGYSYDRGGTEIGLFKIGDDGQLTYRATYHLRSNDYYSSRNYSSRLIGNKLIFYSPLNLDLNEKDPFDSFPALRKWRKGAKPDDFRQIAPATQVYRPIPESYDLDDGLTLHTVTKCDISRSEMSCSAESVMGPSGNVFFVSPKNVYVWASRWFEENSKYPNRSTLFKMPLDNEAPSAIRVSGSPVDQFSFSETENQELNVIVRSESEGDGMWKAEVAEGDIALLRLNAFSFSDGSRSALKASYQPLEKPTGYSFQNRFIDDYVLYGTGDYGEDSKMNILYALNWKTGVLVKVKLDHDVQRLDLLGHDGIVVGSQKDNLLFTSIRLDGSPRIIDSYNIQNASQGDSRSQGFFYKQESSSSGTLGLPIIRSESRDQRTASIVFLRNEGLRFIKAGELSGRSQNSEDDGCKASCVDWYGNARPLFVKGRIFALLGYELVEGQIVSGGIQEIRRLNFAPN